LLQEPQLFHASKKIAKKMFLVGMLHKLNSLLQLAQLAHFTFFALVEHAVTNKRTHASFYFQEFIRRVKSVKFILYVAIKVKAIFYFLLKKFTRARNRVH